MDAILSWLDGALAPLLPADLYAKLDLYYNGSLVCLGAGVALMLLAVVFMIIAVRKARKHALNL